MEALIFEEEIKKDLLLNTFKKISFSKIKILETCFRKYTFKYVENEEEEKNIYLEEGVKFHETIEKFLKNFYSLDLDNIELKLYSLEDYKDFFTRLEKIDRKLLSKNVERFIEVKLELPLYLPSLNLITKIEGYLDLLYVKKDRAIIIDHKNSKKIKYFENYLWQGIIYKTLVYHNLKAKSLFYLNYLNKIIKLPLEKEEYKNEIKIYFSNLINEYLENPYKKNKSFLCNFCSYKNLCEEEERWKI